MRTPHRLALVCLFALTAMASAQTHAYPGNGSDCDIQVSINGAPDNAGNDIHFVSAGDQLIVSFRTPNGTLDLAPFLVAVEIRPTAFPASPLLVPGDAAPSVYLYPPNASIIINGFASVGQNGAPVLYPLGYAVSATVPVFLAGQGLSTMLELFAYDPGHNLVNLGVADGHEFRIN